MREFTREDLVEVFNQCSRCSWMVLDRMGNVIESTPMSVHAVRLRSDGHAVVEWKENGRCKWTDNMSAPLDEVSKTLPDGSLCGAFTSAEAAADAVKKIVVESLESKIHMLKTELAAYEKDLEENDKVLQR